MNEEQARLVLLVKAVESTQTGDTLLSVAQRDAAGARALAASARPASDAKRAAWAEAFMVRRAHTLWPQALQAQERLGLLQGDAWLMRALRWGLPLLGLAVGLGAELWVSPRAIDLLSPALLTLVLWNLLVYLWLAVRALRGAFTAHPGVQWPARVLAWLGGRRLRLGLLGKVGARFQHDWLLTAGAGVAHRLVAAMHLSALLCAVGMLAALWAKGLFTELRVGWESQWLAASHLHAFFATLGAWLGAPDITLQDIQRLEGGAAATKADGSLWARWWGHVVLAWVVLPRLVLAVGSAFKAWVHMKRLHLDMTDPYFVRLLAEHGGPATTVVVQPYSYRLAPHQEAALKAVVRSRLGASASLLLQPPLAYGETLTALPAPGTGQQRHVVALFSLAATPEQETHGALVRQAAALTAGPVEVWLDSATFSTHLAPGARAARLAEREALWRDFLGTVPGCGLVQVLHLAHNDGDGGGHGGSDGPA